MAAVGPNGEGNGDLYEKYNTILADEKAFVERNPKAALRVLNVI
jgi:hypothetical protein